MCVGIAHEIEQEREGFSGRKSRGWTGTAGTGRCVPFSRAGSRVSHLHWAPCQLATARRAAERQTAAGTGKEDHDASIPHLPYTGPRIVKFPFTRDDACPQTKTPSPTGRTATLSAGPRGARKPRPGTSATQPAPHPVRRARALSDPAIRPPRRLLARRASEPVTRVRPPEPRDLSALQIQQTPSQVDSGTTGLVSEDPDAPMGADVLCWIQRWMAGLPLSFPHVPPPDDRNLWGDDTASTPGDDRHPWLGNTLFMC